MSPVFCLRTGLLRSLQFAAGLMLAVVPLRGELPVVSQPILLAGVETNSAPFTSADAAGRPTGFSVELLKEIAREQDLKIEFVTLPWTELLASFRAGRLDIICNVVDTPERRAFIEFSVTTALMQGGLFVRRDLPPVRTPADLAGRRVAVPKDSRAHLYLQHQDWNVQLDFVPGLSEAVEAVHNGQSDMFLATHLVAANLIRQRGYHDIVASELPLSDFDYREHFGVQPGKSDLLARLNEGLLALHVNGTYDRLYGQWLGSLQPRQLGFRDLEPFLFPIAVFLVLILGAFAWQRRILRRVSRQAEALRVSEERLSLVLEGSQDGFWDWNVQTNEVSRSQRWAAMLGYTLDEVDPSRKGFASLIHSDDFPIIKSDDQAIWSERDHFSHEFRMRTKNGEWKWILDRGKVVARDPRTREPLRITGTHSDIMARKQAEEETARLQSKMLETQKLESLGVLAGGIAHDFNNLLTVILGNTALTRLDGQLAPENAARLDKILTASNRAADLCRQLLAYAGKGSFAIGRLNLNDVVNETARLLELSLSRQAVLDFSLANPLPNIEADSSQIRQIIMNLVLNAAEAMGDRPGRIRLVTEVRRLGTSGLPRGQPSADLPAGDYVCLEVSDNGSGMTPAVLERIFDPFYTTKFTGRGLGLAAVLGIVRSHRGALTVTSAPAQGSSFQIYLPVAQGCSDHPFEDKNPPAITTKSSGTVLVVDDEAPVLQLVMSALAIGGYATVGAADGQTALDIFRATPDRFICVLLDLTMPGLNGPKTLQAMRAIRPNIVGIIMSGYSEHDAEKSLAECGAAAFLEKPFTPDILFRKLAHALRPIG